MRLPRILFAAACVASLALSTSASAATILQFSQRSSSDFVSATVSAPSSTTLNTNGPAATPTRIPITITQLGNLDNQNIQAFETFIPSLSSNGSISGGIQNGFNGTILISQNPDGTGNFLTAVVTNGRLSANGASGGFEAASGTTNGGAATSVILTTANLNVAAALGGLGPIAGAVSLALINIDPQQNGIGLTGFRAQNQGSFSTVAIPEPASLLSAGTALIAGLGCFGWARRKSSPA